MSTRADGFFPAIVHTGNAENLSLLLNHLTVWFGSFVQACNLSLEADPLPEWVEEFYEGALQFQRQDEEPWSFYREWYLHGWRLMHESAAPGDQGRAAPDLPQLTAVAPGAIGAWAESLSTRVGQLAMLSPNAAERAIDSAAPDLDADGRAWLLDMAARLRRLASRSRLSPLSAGPAFG